MITGIDCSKETLDVATIADSKTKFLGKFSNNQNGFEKIYEQIKGSDFIVMEVTGPYYLPLANYLVEKGEKVAVVNPLVIKRYCQMKLSRAKTDKKDAVMIAMYGESEKPALWTPSSTTMLAIQQLETYLEGLKKRRTMVVNQLHAFGHTSKLNEKLKRELEDEIEDYDERIARTEKEIKDELNKEHREVVANLETIPGVGPRTASLLTVTTNGFKDFMTYKQVIAYYGVAPKIEESGKSVKKHAYICKQGMAHVRKTLYMAAKSAIRFNKACMNLYTRLRENGKPYKVAMIAVVNKLIKQAFAIAKSGIPYSETFAK